MFGAIGDIFSSAVSAFTNHREAEMNRDWQEHQRKTAYQDTVKDLTAAGLSPMLAYSKGPTSGGSGATAAPMAPLKLGETEQRQSAADLAREQANVAKSTTIVNEATAEKLRAETANINQDTVNKGQPFAGLNEATIKELLARVPQHGASAAQLNTLVKEIQQNVNLRKPQEEFKDKHPTAAMYMNPIRDALSTIFGGLGLLRGSSAMPFVTQQVPKGKK